MKKFLYPLILFLISLLVFYKLDFPFFFTDEILYVQEGSDNLKGFYDQNLQVPFLAKFVAGVTFYSFGYDVFALRAVFSLIFISFLLFLFYFLKKLYGENIGLLGALLYFLGIINFESNRMVMLESPMHLFWLLFLYFFYQILTFKKEFHTQKLYLLTGLFLGLSLITKFTSFILVLFIILGIFYQIVVLNFDKKFLFKKYLYLFSTSGLVVLTSYLHFFLSLGFFDGVKQIVKFMKDTYLQRNIEGKIHLIGGEVYSKSPFYSYFLFSVNSDGIFRSLISIVSLFSLKSVSKISFNTAFFGTFFVLNFLLFVFLSLHNERYISTLWIPLIFLIIEGIKSLNFTEIKKQLFLCLIVLISAIVFFNYLSNLAPTKYHALYLFFKESTNNFITNERMYSYGSVRSLTWYRRYVPNEDLFLYRRDYKIMSKEFSSFNYFAFDQDELKKIEPQENLLYQYVLENSSDFEKIETDFGFLIFKRLGK